MAVWEAATFVTGPPTGGQPGKRVNVDAVGTDWIRILSPSFRKNDGTEHGFIGHGIKTSGEP